MNNNYDDNYNDYDDGHIEETVIDLDKIKKPTSPRRKLGYSILVLVVVLLISVNVYAHFTYDMPGHNNVIRILPEIVFNDFDDKEYTVTDFYDKPVVINIWATWCDHCVTELEYYNNVAAKYKDQVHFIMLDYADGSMETVEKARKFITDSNYNNLSFYYDDTEDSRTKLKYTSLPITFFVYPESYVYLSLPGAFPEEKMLDEAIEKFLATPVEEFLAMIEEGNADKKNESAAVPQ